MGLHSFYLQWVEGASTVAAFALSAPYPETNASVLALHTLGTAVELTTALILLRMFVLLKRSGEKVSGLSWIARLILLTTVIRAIRLVLSWTSISTTPPFWLEIVATALAFITTASIPVIMSAQYPPNQQAGARNASFVYWLQWAMRVNAGCGMMLFCVAWGLRSRTLALLITATMSTIAAVLLGIQAVASKNLQLRQRGLFLFSGFTIAALFVFSAGIFFGYFHNTEPHTSITVALCVEVYWMLIVLGMLFVFANLRLADVVVKKVVHLYLWSTVALTLWAAIHTLAKFPIPLRNTYQATFLSLLGIALIGAVLALTPRSIRHVDGWIDHWVFQLPDTNLVFQQFWEEISKLESQEDVYRAGERVVSAFLALSSAKIISVAELKETEADLPAAGPDPYFLPADSSLRTFFTPPVDVLVPVFHEGIVRHWMMLSRGLVRPPLTAMELNFISRVLIQIQVRMDVLLAEQTRLERLRREDMLLNEIAKAELRALRAQINPHFLFNSLNAIADLSIEAPTKAEEMTLRLSAVFRYVLINTERPFASIKEEIDFARSYLEIEEVRFGSRLKVHFNVDPSVLHERIPTLLLQPLIENALKHGLSHKREGGTLSISANRTLSGFSIVVSDNGVGLGVKPKGVQHQGANVGLRNVQKRLHTAYQGRATFSLTAREGGGSEATVTIRERRQDSA